jgi:aryl-alcohol dehydrogenase-like predicted oxidoreductase
MEYRTLGRSGVKVAPLCLGCMNFGRPTDEDESIRIIHAAIDAGVNFIDTADVYNSGVSEQIVGKAIKDRRDHVVLATKVHGRVGDDPNAAGNSRAHILDGVEASLKRLDTDHIDLYQLHRPDPKTPMDEQLDALSDLVHQGKVRYIGTSTFPAWQLCETLWISEKNNYERFVSEQPPYSLLCRGIEKEVLPFCEKYGFAVLPWSPLAGGWLTGKYRRGQEPPSDSRGARKGWDTESSAAQMRLDVVEKLIALSEEVGVPLTQFALAWTLANPVVTSPIIGPRTMEQLDDNLESLNVQLSDDVLERIDEIVPPGTNVPG